MPKEPNLSNEAQRIIDALDSGDTSLALRLYENAGGAMFPFLHGYAGLGSILDKMPEEFWRQHESVLGGLIFHLTKRGQAGRAKSYFEAGDLEFERGPKFELYGLLLALHLGDPVTPEALAKWRRLERQLPVAQPLLEGLYFNAMTVMHVRIERTDEARVSAQQAISCFREAGHSHLEHFIHIHLADLDLVEGRLRAARRELAAAERSLAQSGVRYGNETDLIEVIRLAIDYEAGSFSHIPERASALRASLVGGDSWAELFIQLARISALSVYFLNGRGAALEELEFFQADYARRHGGSAAALDVIGALIERLDWRLDESRDVLHAIANAPMQSTIGAAIRDELVNGMAHSEPASSQAPTPRAAIDLELQSAMRMTGKDRRRRIEKALWLAVREGHIAPFLEHRDVFLGVASQLAKTRFAGRHRGFARMTTRVLRLVDQSFVIPEDLRALGFNFRQYRVATALQTGATSKQIARQLGISEATVKYHLTALYRIVGVGSRAEFIDFMLQFDDSAIY